MPDNYVYMYTQYLEGEQRTRVNMNVYTVYQAKHSVIINILHFWKSKPDT